MPTLPKPNQKSSNLSDRVGNGRANRPEDVLWVKEALRQLGRFNDGGPRHPYIDRRLHDSIDRYQRDRGLRRDSFLSPGGETECALCVELSRLMGRARR